MKWNESECNEKPRNSNCRILSINIIIHIQCLCYTVAKERAICSMVQLWHEEENEQEKSSSLYLIFIFFPLNELHQNMLNVDDDRYFVCPGRQTGTGRVNAICSSEKCPLYQNIWQYFSLEKKRKFVIVVIIVVMERVLI